MELMHFAWVQMLVNLKIALHQNSFKDKNHAVLAMQSTAGWKCVDFYRVTQYTLDTFE